ncbi:hypothetical protein D3218_19035 [Aureimonas flava]|uniref:Uncharacterized protein n=1 Tax=Aureimonas flava TaxID=2320271 RepID=A0A3A1WMD2_9HYPH|nr:hypothetical protein D3218_19035 [Aureimonas flava]
MFRWTPALAEVIPFPCRARIAKVRRTAQILDETTPQGADAYWERTVSDLRRQMQAAGILGDRIDAELRTFFDAVQAELYRRGYAALAGSTGDTAA